MTANTIPYIKVKNISEYIQAKKLLANIVFIITPSGNFYDVNGNRIEADIFENASRVELQVNRAEKGTQIGRNKWID